MSASASSPVPAGSADADADARRRHYGVFYGVRAPEADGACALVLGNCQAESLRLFLDGGGLATVRTPPVHELTEEDLPHLDRWLGRTRLLVAQPIRPDYRGLPVGTAQLTRRLARGARVVRVPVIRFAGLYPTHAIVRPPEDPSLQPPLVEYHDLAVLTEAAARRRGTMPSRDPLREAAVKAVAALSVSELHRREVAHDTVRASDLFAEPSFGQMRTLNHPGNSVWRALAARVRRRARLPGHPGCGPGRPVLDAVHAPRAEAVVAAFGLAEEPSPDWTVDGRTVGWGEVREAHLRWYERHPSVVDAGLARHARALGLLGLA